MDKRTLVIKILQKLQGKRDLADWFLLILEDEPREENNDQLMDELIESIYKAMKSTVVTISHYDIERAIATIAHIRNKEKDEAPTQWEFDNLLDGI
jgi:methionine aminopeptidase